MSQPKPKHILRSGAAAAVLAAFVGLAPASVSAQPATAVTVGAADLGGVVTGKNGPEAGVWVIAETTDLPTKYAKIVVTDALGRYLIPDLPRANYSVFVRGYGLVDSPRVKAAPGRLSTSPRCRRRTKRQRRNIIRRSTGSRCCTCRPRPNFPSGAWKRKAPG